MKKKKVVHCFTKSNICWDNILIMQPSSEKCRLHSREFAFLLQVFVPWNYANVFRLNPVTTFAPFGSQTLCGYSLAHMVSQKGIERERDGEEDKAIETTSRCIFCILKRKAYFQCFSHLWENLFLCFCVEALALNPLSWTWKTPRCPIDSHLWEFLLSSAL